MSSLSAETISSAPSAAAHAQTSALADLLPPLPWPGPAPIPVVADQAILDYLPRFARAMREAFESTPLLRPGALVFSLMLALEKQDPRAARSILARKAPDLHLAGVSARIIKRVHEACAQRWLAPGSRGQSVALDQEIVALAMQPAAQEHSFVDFEELLAYAHAWRCIGLGSAFKTSTAHEPILALSAQFATRLCDESSLEALSHGRSKRQLESEEGRGVLAAGHPFSRPTDTPWRSIWMTLGICDALAKEAALGLDRSFEFSPLFFYPAPNSQGGIPTNAGLVEPVVFVRQRIQQIFSEQEAKLLQHAVFNAPALNPGDNFSPNAPSPGEIGVMRRPRL